MKFELQKSPSWKAIPEWSFERKQREVRVKYLRIFFISALLTSALTANAETQFIKYKNYLIPISICEKPKVLITTDYGFPDNGGDSNEPQDMVHFLAYSNHFDVRAIVASRTLSPVIRTDELNDTISRYAHDYNAFFLTSSFGADYPTPAQLSSIVFAGVPLQTGSSPTNHSGSAAISTIVIEAKKASPACPLNILVWGAITDTAAALSLLTTNERENLRVIAIGSSNADFDPNAWSYVQSQQNNGGEFILLNGRNPDAFRSLLLGGECSNNPVLYDSVGVETIMNDLTDGVSILDSGLRGLLQQTRADASIKNCSAQFSNSLRMADSLTTLYFLDDILGFDGELREIIERNDSSSSTGVGQDSVLRDIYNHYRGRMNDIY